MPAKKKVYISTGVVGRRDRKDRPAKPDRELATRRVENAYKGFRTDWVEDEPPTK